MFFKKFSTYDTVQFEIKEDSQVTKKTSFLQIISSLTFLSNKAPYSITEMLFQHSLQHFTNH